MFKLYSIDKDNREQEVLPTHGIYVVYELFEYKFVYTGTILTTDVFLEDELLDYSWIINSPARISLIGKKRLFEDYFGYLTVMINNIRFNFEVRIQKLKVPELEEILLYLWNQEPVLFDNFFSKSTLKAKLSRENNHFDYSSKFVNIFEDFYSFFRTRYFIFKSLPHSVLRTRNVISKYDNADISSGSIDWLVNNLDELHIDYLYKNVENSIKLNNNYGLVEKIFTEQRFDDYNIYENQIVLGAFIFIKSEIKNIKETIEGHLLAKKYYDQDYYSIDEFKIIPFLRLKDDLIKVENKINSLYKKYRDIFPKASSKNSLPKLTPVFSNKKHYTDAYNKIRLMRDIRLNLEGELNLLNIKKMSTLYERFNLLVIINALKSKSPQHFSKDSQKTDDNVFQQFHFQYANCDVHLYYDYVVSSLANRTGLQRISKGYYRPDYIVKVISKEMTKFYILDSKYSSESTVKNNHLSKCIKSYILDMAITGLSSTKIEELILLYPGDRQEIIFGNETYNPMISIMPSKVSKQNLNEFISNVLLGLI